MSLEVLDKVHGRFHDFPGVPYDYHEASEDDPGIYYGFPRGAQVSAEADQKVF